MGAPSSVETRTSLPGSRWATPVWAGEVDCSGYSIASMVRLLALMCFSAHILLRRKVPVKKLTAASLCADFCTKWTSGFIK